MKLWACSDLHVGFRENRELVAAMPPRPDDWLLLAGDVGESEGHLRWLFERLAGSFRQIVWAPGNHELWTVPGEDVHRGVAKYEALVAICRAHGVLTPEDPYPVFDDGLRPHSVAPLFTLYDGSFCPADVHPGDARAWAASQGVECADDHLLHPDPHGSIEAWCEARCQATEARLRQLVEASALPTVLAGHFPLRAELARLPRVPAMSVWCGTRRTQDWPRRFRASVVVSGHLHLPGTRWIDGVRFEEVSLGYPREWRRQGRRDGPLRQILPAATLHD